MRELALALSLSGCSFMTVTGPKANVPTADCTTTYAAPIVDGVFTAGFAALSVLGFAVGKSTSSCNPQDHNQDFCTSGTIGGATVGAVLLIPTAVFAISTWYGGSRVGNCRDQRANPPPTAIPTAPPPRPWNPDE